MPEFERFAVEEFSGIFVIVDLYTSGHDHVFTENNPTIYYPQRLEADKVCDLMNHAYYCGFKDFSDYA